MSENKKYYYMKLKDTFFDSEEMKIIESMQNGVEYQNLYLKMCLLSIKAEGKLIFKDILPYDLSMLSTVLRVNIDTVKTAVEIFQRIGLVSIIDNGTIYMADIQSLIGRSSTEAERIKAYRERLKIESVQMYENSTPELEKEKEIELDIEKEIKKEQKHKYGEYKHIFLTDSQYHKLQEETGNVEAWIREVDEGIQLHGYKYKDHYLAILKWYRKDPHKYKREVSETQDIIPADILVRGFGV